MSPRAVALRPKCSTGGLLHLKEDLELVEELELERDQLKPVLLAQDLVNAEIRLFEQLKSVNLQG